MSGLELTLTEESKADDSKKVSEMIVKFIDSDPEIKSAVGEMMDHQADPPTSQQNDRTGGDKPDYTPGTKNERILVRTAQ